MYSNTRPRRTSAASCNGNTARPTSGTNAIRPTPDHASADANVAATLASALAWSGVGLIAFVPLVGLAVFPLQLAALVLRGLAFEYLGLTALGAYLTLYQGYVAKRSEALGRSTLTSTVGHPA